MQKWRRISLTGIILGIVAIGIDFLMKGLPYAIIIPLEIISIILIFTGLIIRKVEKTREKNHR